MDVDDEFGDLYTNIGPEMGENMEIEVSADEGDLDDEELLYGISSSSLAVASKPSSLSASIPRRSALHLATVENEVDHDELLLYGQLYGVSAEKPAKAGGPLLGVEIKGSSAPRPVKRQDYQENARSTDIPDENNFDLLVEERENSRGRILGLSGDITLGVVGIIAASGESAEESESAALRGLVSGGFGNRVFPSENDTLSLRRELLDGDASRQMGSPPGLSCSVRVQQEAVTEEGGHVPRGAEWDGGLNEGAEDRIEGDVEDWDSDSEDDIHIVLNDETSTYIGEKPNHGDEDERSEDEDEEDLVIVAGDDDALPVEEQDWEDQPIPLDALPTASGTPLSSGLDRVPGGEDKGHGGKGSGGQGTSSGVPRIGYSGQGYHTHHMQYKYVRPGAGASSGMAPPSSHGSPQAGVSNGRGTGGGWGPGRGVAGRGDWTGGAGRGSTGQRPSQGSGGVASWGPSRGYQSGVEFNLPPTKTVFDVDLDALEEKPWRKPGVDITDYFNFSFTENSWKQYCRQLAQLRLEATMQSKIRVYESGRSEQDYDPDLPPELAAATGMQETSGDLGLLQQRPQDGGSGAGAGRGRGFGRGRMMPPAGRAIQVEGGGGERRPSADVRRQRSRDSDAVIQIILQDASHDESPASVPVNEVNEESQDEDNDRGGAVPEKEIRFYRPWEIDVPTNMWERDNMPMGLGPMPNMMGPHGSAMVPGHRIDVEGPGSFPVGQGIPTLQPCPSTNFAMFPGTPFPRPSTGRGGLVRPALYDAQRPILSLQVPVGPPEEFGPLIVPPEYHDPNHRRTPPHMNSPRRTPYVTSPRRTTSHLMSPRGTPPQGPSGDWDDELSNGSAANWNGREGGNRRDLVDLDGGNGDWHADEIEIWERNYPRRLGRETDQLSHRERSMDEVSAEGKLEQHNRSVSKEYHVEDDEWDGGHSKRFAKKQKVQPHSDTRVKSGRENYNSLKALKNNARKEDPARSWEPSKEQSTLEDDTVQIKRRDSHSKASERKGRSIAEDSLGHQRKELSWNDRQDGDLKNRRQPREREEMQRRRVKEADIYDQRSREDLGRDRHREDNERERRNSKKAKDDVRVKDEDKFSQDERGRRNIEDHMWTSREQEEARAREVMKSLSSEREFEHSKEKRRRVEDRGKLKRRMDGCRDIDGRVRGRSDDLKETQGRVKGQLEDRRENDFRLRGRFEDVRGSDGKVKGRFEDVRGKERIEDAREIDGKIKGRLEEARESDSRGKGWFQETRENEGRAKSRLEDIRESDGRVKSRVGNTKETDGRQKGLLEDVREGDGRVKSRSDDLRESDARTKARLEDLRESEGRSKGWSENFRESDGRVKTQVGECRDSDSRVKGRLDDFEEGDIWVKGRLEDVRDSVGRGKLRPEEGREIDGRGRQNDKEEGMHPRDDLRKDEKSSRGESIHPDRNHSVESRKVSEEQRHHKEKRGREGTISAKETLGDRNGSLPYLDEDKSYRSPMDGSKKQRVEEYRTSTQFEKAATRDSDESAPTSAWHKEKKSVIQKRGHFARRLLETGTASHQPRVAKDDKVLSLGNGSSEEEAELHGRSKLERWTSRKEQDSLSAFGGDTTHKWQNLDCEHGGGPSTSHHTESKQQSRVEQPWKEGWKEKQKVTKHSGKRLFESEQKEPSPTAGSVSGDAAMEFPVVVTKDATEKRKERLERLRLQAEEVAAKRQKNEASITQAVPVVEVKQERPARKRRWGNG